MSADTRIDPLDALLALEAALATEERDLRGVLNLGANDIVVLRLLLAAEQADALVRPSEISRTLAISTAATTALIDRLETRGYLARRPHESDRRSIRVTATIPDDSPIRAAFATSRAHRADALDGLLPEQSDAVASAFRRLSSAIAPGE
ncbi:putative Transcriptional regulator [Microbacterium sp. C448]|uniref:MarR family transcriptional regulator n=1 Tax=Microbacterium TaxID=33882 RepID=UPI0003DE4FDD|nr:MULTISPECIES: MarR family transcriptional regulator [Microbacterium]CDK00692.1 putative Transcriptional regulator [Microbacterium sp. C448]